MTSFLGSTTLGGTHNANSGGSQLQQRLAAKYQTSLGKFRESIRALNEGVDERQRDRIRHMKMALLDAHAETELMLRTEQETIDEHEELLRSHQEICDIAPPGEVLPALADPFHRCGEVDLVASQERMREERLRIVHLAVVLRQAYEARVAIIQDCVEELEAEEQNRRAVIQTALRELMLTLAKISFTSITGSHVLAQRVIHSVNEQISTNYLAMRTILAQLRRREVFKHLHYTSTLGTIISATLRRMQRSNLWFARTLLQSDVFRRPMSRMRHVEGVCSVSVGARRDGGHFLNSLAVMVRSLRDSREMVEATSEEERQPCGGSIPAGWLRHYSPKVSQPVFPTRPTELVHEWRMRANVVIRNSLAACVALIDEVRREESGISAAAAALCEEVADGIRWVFSPLPEEAEVLRAVSLTPGELDAAYRPFVEVNAEEIGRQRTAAENLLSPVVAAIGEETEWFHNLLNKGLLRSHEVFEQALLAAYMSILRIFEKATEELITTADNVFGFTRSFYHQRYEQRRDYEDVVAMLDANFSTIGEKLLHAGSRAAAEELFGEGLACLDEIAAAHSRFHHQTMRDVGGIIELVRANAATYCGRLQKKIGVEAVVETEARLTDERAAKMQAALQQLLQEYHSHARRKGRKAAAGDDGAATAPTMDMVENIPLEEVAYPQFSALNGCTYNIVGPLALLEAEVEHHKPEPVLPSTTTSSRSKRASSKRRSTGDSASSHRRRNVDRSTDASAVATPDLRAATEVSANFITTYEAFFRESILNDENFVSVADLDAWKEVLRVELLNWLVALRESAVQYIDAYCVRVREESNREINELLRRHRRRPAAFQADFYEARVRELEDIVSSSERSCARLRDKVAKVDAMVVGLKRGVVVAEEGRKLSEALAAVETKTGEAPSISILQVQERRFASLADHYRDSFASQAHATIDAVEKMRANIEEECMQLLQDRARDIAREEHGGTSPEEAIERDPITQRARAVLQKLRDAVEQLHLFTTEERELRERTVEAARERYDGLCARNVAELSLFAKVQELFGHLKTQVQGVLLASKTGEGELEKLVAALEERVKKSASRVNLAATMKSIVRYDHSLDSSANTAVAAEELSPDEPDKALEDLHEHLRLCTVALQRTLQSCEAAEVLGLVDQLREQLFVRGASLGALVCAVEMVKIIPDNYIEPRAMTEKEVAEMAAAAPAGQSRSGRKAKGGKSAAQALQLSPLPVVQTIEHQVRHWIAKTKGDILALVQTHMEAFEPPLTRRLQGMCGGSAEDVANYIDVSCKTQEERARQHVATALAVYHQHVLRIHAVVENLPQFLAAAIYAFSATAVERRVESVLRVFGNFYRHSSILKGRHQRVVKVSLGSKYNRETLMQLTEVEAMRQRMTEEMIARFWGFAIRELQDEAGLHVVRCHHTATTLFNLLKGLITPEHLTPVEMGVPVGHHRGLKHLLQMRAKDGKVKDGQTSNGGGGKKEKKNTQDGPLLKQDASQRNRANMAAVGDSSALPSPAYAEADYPGLPLHTFRPLEAFNDENPAYVLHAPMAARLFYPTNTAATDAAQPNRKGGARGRKTQEMPEEAIALSPSFTAPSTRVHQEVIARARESVAVFQATAQEVVEDTMRSFRSWVQREAQWRDGWALTVNRLRGGSSIGPRAGPPGGLRPNPPGSPNTATAKS